MSVTSLADRDADGLTDGAYVAKFSRPSRGSYMFKTVYAGSAIYLRSSRTLRFKL